MASVGYTRAPASWVCFVFLEIHKQTIHHKDWVVVVVAIGLSTHCSYQWVSF